MEENDLRDVENLFAQVYGGGEAQQSSPLAWHPSSRHPLLITKLHLPRLRTRLVARAHLIERIRRGVEQALTLISAPAGFGKTTLLAQCFRESGMPVAWLSLEPEDNDPTCFLSSIIAALQTLDAQLGARALEVLHTPQPPPPEMVLAMLINELADRGGEDVTLVLDDYHVITADSLHCGITFLLEHLPPQTHLVLSTRADPPLPLARLRARGQLTEVRAADLRFDVAEVSTFLQDIMGLALPVEAMSILEQRTEGWIAGLQLAALSLRERADISAFLAAFRGSHRYVLDYLSDEVLTSQPTAVQIFLLHTCILNHLSGPLCDAVTEQEGSQAMLETLERANLFVVALDDERCWYRYHHLFAEMLLNRLQQWEPTVVATLHRRASAWYCQHDQPSEAIQHALAIPDTELAARLIEPVAFPMALQGRVFTVLGWLHALPEALLQTRLFLYISYAGLLILTNQLEIAEAHLRAVEKYVQEGMSAEQARSIQGWVRALQGSIASYVGDIPYAVSLGHQALELLPETEVVPRIVATFSATLSYWEHGDVTLATEHELAAAHAFICTCDIPFASVASTARLARLRIMQGKLHQAAALYEQLERVAPRPEALQAIFGSVFYDLDFGELLCEWNKLDAAEQHLIQGMALINVPWAIEPFVATRGYLALARLQQARGKACEALTTLDALERLAEQRRFISNVGTQGKAMRARIKLAQGHVEEAIRWADNSGLSTQETNLPYFHESEYLSLARVRIAQAQDEPSTPLLQDVLHLLDRLLLEAEAKARLGSILEILVVRALALATQGNRQDALTTLERALALAEPEGYIRIFVDEGKPMLALLRRTYLRNVVPDYVATLLAAFDEPHTLDHSPSLFPRSDMLAESLTEREREVLSLLLEGASNREIAQRLVLSVNTVKRHVYNLSGKLRAQNRAQVILRARSLNLM